MKTVQRKRRLSCAAALAATLAAAAGSATAADLAPGYAPPVAPVPVYRPFYSWTGFYVGINGGGGWGRSQWDGLNTFDVSGGMIGGTIGYNWQISRVVLGAEGDIDWSGIDGTTTVLCAPGCTTRNYWLATVRGRIGYSWDRFLPYLTGGLAVGDIQAKTPGLPGGTVSNAGWTIGAGVEVGIVSNVSVKAEYLFVDLADFNCGLNCGLLPTGNVSFDANIFRGGLNVRF
ncbi:MAG TPA: outer membrane protein [Xanthobacteraceae bacterium]|jgi:outer membrane immunogenic protein